jgi:hypothetical protein
MMAGGADPSPVSAIAAGAIHAYYLFDVAESIRLPVIRGRFGAQAAEATLADKAPGPSRVRYVQPPVMVEGAALGLTEVEGFRVRVKFYDYGVISLKLWRPFSGAWADLVRFAQEFIESEPLERRALEACQQVVGQVSDALAGARSSVLDEDYLAFSVHALDEPLSAEALLERHGVEIAQMLRGERQPLSRQEREEVLRHRLSYLADDVVVPAWNAAFVYDTEAAAQAAIEILELANSQLLEFRYHDELLESELSRIYAALQAPRKLDWILGRRFTRAARRLQSLFIDVNELTDRTENAVKFVGDMYAARLFSLAAARLGLDGWKRNVQDKLETLDDIYRFAVEQTGMSQGNILELVIVLILVLELGLFFAGIM